MDGKLIATWVGVALTCLTILGSMLLGYIEKDNLEKEKRVGKIEAKLDSLTSASVISTQRQEVLSANQKEFKLSVKEIVTELKEMNKNLIIMQTNNARLEH